MRSHSLFCGGKGKRRPQHFYFDEKIRWKKISLSKTLNNFLSLFKVSKEFSPPGVCVCVCQAPCKKQAAAFRLI